MPSAQAALQGWERTYNTIRPHQAVQGRTPAECLRQRHVTGHATISADGRYIAFRSMAWNLVAGDTDPNLTTLAFVDIFVHDRQTGTTARVSVASDGTQCDNHNDSPAISADGRYVAFTSVASNMVTGDTNGVSDVFLHDRQTGITTRLSVTTDGTQGNGESFGAAVSADSRYVAFTSAASNLVVGDVNRCPGWGSTVLGTCRDVFLHDRQISTTTMVSSFVGAVPANGPSEAAALNSDGRFVAFVSAASNLVQLDKNGFVDVFVYDRLGVAGSP